VNWPRWTSAAAQNRDWLTAVEPTVPVPQSMVPTEEPTCWGRHRLLFATESTPSSGAFQQNTGLTSLADTGTPILAAGGVAWGRMHPVTAT
jgi:hypothetical protein